MFDSVTHDEPDVVATCWYEVEGQGGRGFTHPAEVDFL